MQTRRRDGRSDATFSLFLYRFACRNFTRGSIYARNHLPRCRTYLPLFILNFYLKLLSGKYEIHGLTGWSLQW